MIQNWDWPGISEFGPKMLGQWLRRRDRWRVDRGRRSASDRVFGLRFTGEKQEIAPGVKVLG
jgi:hypothetical protein